MLFLYFYRSNMFLLAGEITSFSSESSTEPNKNCALHAKTLQHLLLRFIIHFNTARTRDSRTNHDCKKKRGSLQIAWLKEFVLYLAEQAAAYALKNRNDYPLSWLYHRLWELRWLKPIFMHFVWGRFAFGFEKLLLQSSGQKYPLVYQIVLLFCTLVLNPLLSMLCNEKPVTCWLSFSIVSRLNLCAQLWNMI